MAPFQEFDVWVEIEGKRCQEYGLEITDKEVPVVACWIPSEIGKAFTVHIRDNVRSSPTRGYISVDGVRTGGKVLHANEKTAVHRGFRTSPHTVQPFLFTRVDLTDDDNQLHRNIPQAFGQIEVSLDRIVVTGRKQYPTKSVPAEYKVHERAKKAIVQQVGFGESVMTKTTGSLSVKITKKIAQFVFKYRSLDQLIANDIAPPSPKAQNRQVPKAATTKRKHVEEPEDKKPTVLGDVIELSDSETDEIRGLQAKLERLKEKQQQKVSKKVKREKVKRETVPVVGAFIDLT
ncbi:hypothetical protein C8J56DRAFT_822455 [Mycena floridula]|nr:hypothetical protein C8J56DRAFT_822455 [Mycena floridula]